MVRSRQSRQSVIHMQSPKVQIQHKYWEDKEKVIRVDAVVTTMEPYKMSATASSAFLVARLQTDIIKSQKFIRHCTD